jgi:hypothetical protein
MKIFLSWSGETSKKVATALNKWLPYILQPLHPSLSTEISKGDRWGPVLEEELKDAEYGIICLTKYNSGKPWLNFESGVLSRFIDRACLTPFLFKVDPASLTGPLSVFQSTQYTRDDFLRLIQSINHCLGTRSVDDTVVQASFSTWWKDLEEELNSITPNPQEETQTAYSWLYTFADLAIHEENKGTRSIWIITDDLAKHASKYEVREKLKTNLAKGVEYRFFVPVDTALSTELEDLKKNSDGRLDYRCFETADFYTHAATDYIIVNSDGPLLTFFRLMIENSDDLWVKVDETAAIKLKRRFEEYWDKGESTTIKVGPTGS